MKTFFTTFILFFLLLTEQTYSQELSGKITGKIVESSSANGIDFAALNIFKIGGEEPLKTVTSGNGGNFKFDKLPGGTYTLVISFVGYTTRKVGPIEISSQSLSHNLDTIRLSSDSKVLNEVVITADKPLVEYSADKITYNVNQSIVAEGGTATDILKNVPLVTVDVNGKPSIAGKRNTRVFIDGKPSDYSTSNITDLLNVLPSDAIDKMEVITSPPVKYSSDGEGIINIVLKKGVGIGLNGSLSLTAGRRGNYNGNGQIAYRNKKLAYTSSYGIRNIESINRSSSARINTFPDTLFFRNQESESRNTTFGHNLRNSLVWDLSKDQNLNFSANLNLNNTKGNTRTDNHELDENSIEQKIRKQSTANTSGAYNYALNLDYNFKLSAKNEKLQIGVNFSGNSSDQDRLFNRSELYPNGDPFILPSSQKNNNSIWSTGWDLKADYDKPLKNSGSFEAGIQATLRKNENDLRVQKLDNQSQQFIPSLSLNNVFNFIENIYSAYGSYNLKTRNKWSFRMGGRIESTFAGLESPQSGAIELKPYFNFFPNISAGKFFGKHYSLNASYNMRINRPRDFALNPQVDNIDTTNVSFGNPLLKPSFTQQIELSLGTYGKQWSFSPRISYSNSTRIIERIRTVEPSGPERGNSETTYKNLGNSQSFTLNLSGNYRPTRKISLNAGSSFSRVIYETNGNAALSRDGWNFRDNVGFSIQLPKKATIEANLNYSNNTSAQGRQTGSVSSSIGGRKSFLNNKLNVRFMANDPLKQQSRIEFTEGEYFRQERSSIANTRNFSITLNYRFTKLKNKIT